MISLFVTGTDTHIGKTITSAILASVMNAAYWKPIQSGLADEKSDSEIVMELVGLSPVHIFPSQYQFQLSLSPHHAAEYENVEIDLAKITAPITEKGLITEGSGGVLVPINNTCTIRDLIKKLNYPVVIVARGTLGTINHTLLTIEALKQKNICILGVIFNGELNRANQTTIEKLGNVNTLFCVPHFSSLTKNNLQAWIANHQQTILQAIQNASLEFPRNGS